MMIATPRPALTSSMSTATSTRSSSTSRRCTTASAAMASACSPTSRRSALLSRFSDTITRAQQELQAMVMANSQRPPASSWTTMSVTNPAPNSTPCRQYPNNSNSSDAVDQLVIPTNTKAAAAAVCAGTTSHAGKRKRINGAADGRKHGPQLCRLHEEAAALHHPLDDAAHHAAANPHHADDSDPSSTCRWDLISHCNRTAKQQHKQQAELTSTWTDFLVQVKREPDARRRAALIQRRRRTERQAVCALKRTVFLNVPVDLSDCAIYSSSYNCRSSESY